MYSDDEWVEFSPPDTGLIPGEEVVWSRRSGMTAWVMLSGGCCIVFSPWVLLFIYTFSGPLLGNVVLAIVGIGILLTIIEFINSRRTKYYLTTRRIVEVRGGLIHAQIQLESFQGVGINDYLTLKSTYREGGDYFYEARIRDPSSGKVLRLTGLDEDGKEIISKLGVGQIWIEPNKWDVPSFELGYFTDAGYQKRGYALEASIRSLKFLFEDLKAHKVSIITQDINERSWKLAERLGFKKEAHFRESHIKDKKRWGMLYYGMLKNEYRKTIKD
ncbi:N-acetyltransferase [Candidatus Thorarchaeota archaeon]|nr:MAG: N-acetyltransferase [Candidatus Thorarchaeota archaeon]